MMVLEWIQRDKSHVLELSHKGAFRYRLSRWAVYYLVIIVSYSFMGASQEFVYFQF